MLTPAESGVSVADLMRQLGIRAQTVIREDAVR
jgi:sulfur carrier protein ThiS